MSNINRLFETYGQDTRQWKQAINDSKATYGKFGRVKLEFTLPDNSVVVVSKNQIKKISENNAKALEKNNSKFTQQLQEERMTLTGFKKQVVELREKIGELFGRRVGLTREGSYHQVSLEDSSKVEVKNDKIKYNENLKPLILLFKEINVSDEIINGFVDAYQNDRFDGRLRLALNDKCNEDRSLNEEIRQAIQEFIDSNPLEDKIIFRGMLNQILIEL